MEYSKVLIGYDGTKPVYAYNKDFELYEKRKKLKLSNEGNDRDNFMVNFMKVKEILGKLVGYAIVSILAFMLGVIITNNSNSNANIEPQAQVLPKNEIKMNEYKLLWDAEAQAVTLMDRKNTASTLILSKDVTNAIFNLKASTIQADFSQVTNGGVAPRKSYANKTYQPKPTQSVPK